MTSNKEQLRMPLIHLCFFVVQTTFLTEHNIFSYLWYTSQFVVSAREFFCSCCQEY